MAETYTKLFNTIITSSIWSEDDKTRILWVTLLALSDFDGNVFGSIPGIADMARMSVVDCEKSLNKLLSPDKYSRSKDSEGKRIQETNGGWKIINHEKYRNKGGSRAEYYRKYRATVAQHDCNNLQQTATQTETETEAVLKDMFEKSRNLFGGRKNGLDVEFEYFRDVCKRKKLKWKEVVLLLSPAIEKENLYRQQCEKAKEFCPPWKNFKTWIYNQCWTQEFPVIEKPKVISRRMCSVCHKQPAKDGALECCGCEHKRILAELAENKEAMA